MPNPGGPYGGCNECRRRKVKCDQTYPACFQCLKRGTTCPGTIDKGSRIFRDETRKIVSKCDYQQWTEQCATIVLSAPAVAHPSADLLTAFFFDQMTCPASGWYAYLPRLHQQVSGNSHLCCSIQAASLFILANQRPDHPELVAQARVHYGDALSALNCALGDESERLKDEVLCVVLVLMMIEDITGSSNQSCGAHLSGLQKVLRMRKGLGIKNMFGAEVWHAVAMRSQSLILQTNGKGASSEEILIPAMLVTPALKTHKVLQAVRKFKDLVAELLFGSRSRATGGLLGLLRRAKQLDLELRSLTDSAVEQSPSRRWRRQMAFLPSVTAYNWVEYFASLEAAQYWNQNRCARIDLHTSILKLTRCILLQHYYELDLNERYEAEVTAQESNRVIACLLDAICSSIPFSLHQIDSTGKECESDRSQRVLGAAGLIWPLQVVLECEQRSQSQRQIAIDTLREIGYYIGVKQAVVVLQEYE